jgi:hypothetical protein
MEFSMGGIENGKAMPIGIKIVPFQFGEVKTASVDRMEYKIGRGMPQV